MPGEFTVRLYSAVHWLLHGHRADVAFDGVGLFCLACDLPSQGHPMGASV